jgi:hypothetical protein
LCNNTLQSRTPKPNAAFPHISLATIYDALACYYDNREEVDADIAANTEIQARRRFSV